MELEVEKKELVNNYIETIPCGVAYFHMVEYNFHDSIITPNRLPVEYRISNGKTYQEAFQLWLEGLAFLKVYDDVFHTDLFYKNFTEELYFFGEKRVSIIVHGSINPIQSEHVKINVNSVYTPSSYHYYEINVTTNNAINVQKHITSNSSSIGDHIHFIHKAKKEIEILQKDPNPFSNVIDKDAIDFKDAIDRAFSGHPDLIVVKEALCMAILYVCPTTENREKEYIALIPPAFEIENKEGNNISNKQITAGGVALFSNNKIILQPYFFDYVQNWVSIHTTRSLARYTLKKSEKAAKAAIMSRNMSHNLGSHVMSYLKQHLSSVTSMMRDNVLHEIISHQQDCLPSWNSEISKEKVNENLALPFLVGMGHFVSYLQERQDFIATIATDYIPYNSTVNFKDNIYDELNPDKRYERHSERSNLKIDNILLGNIARSEGLGRHTSPTKGEGSKLCDIILKFGEFDGNLGSNEEDLERLRRFDVSLPSGIVGRQAVFSILENIIRNAAKHGNWKKTGKLELKMDYYSKDTIDLAPNDDQDEGCYSLRQILQSFYVGASDDNDLYFITITDNSETDKEHLIRLRKSLCDSYLNSANKGLKEMRISASWLRSIKEEDICYNPYQSCLDNPYKLSTDSFDAINPNLKAPILYVRLHVPGKYISPSLQYIFCLPIPREIAIITSESSSQEWKDKMRKYNWRVYTENETTHEFLEQESNKSFDFVLCDTKEMYDLIRPYSSAKTFSLSDPKVGLNLDSFKGEIIDRENILKTLYKHISGESQNEFVVIDDKTVFGQAKQLYEEGKCERIEIKAEDIEDKIKLYKIVQVLSYQKEKKTTDNIDSLEEKETIINKELFEGFSGGIYYKAGNIVVGNATKPIYSRYSYRAHHEAEDQFFSFMEYATNHQIDYVEGITGNNATDRLIRHDSLTPKWYYCHMHSIKQKVAIMDERIFYKIYGIDEASFVRGKAYVPKTDFLSGEKELDEDLENAKSYYKTILPEDAFERIDDAADMKTLQGIVSDDYAAFIRSDKVYSKGYTGYTYFQKGIIIYTFIQAVERNVFELVGIQMDNEAVNYNKNSFGCTCIPIAELRWNQSELSITPLSSFIKSDFISIHQGLLDKLYEAFDIKDDSCAKDKIVEKLYNIFSSHNYNEIIKEKDSTAFYPGFFIHSGRSKPSAEVMSQRVPFIQYATLEHAVLDCKYSLIELLDNARYE